MTVNVFELAVLLVLAVALGAVVPALLEMKRFARTARDRIERTGPKLDKLIEDAQVSATQLKQISEVFRGKDDELKRLSASMTQAVDAFEKVEKGLRIGSAVGAAVAPAIATFLSTMTEEQQGMSAKEPAAAGPNGVSQHQHNHLERHNNQLEQGVVNE